MRREVEKPEKNSEPMLIELFTSNGLNLSTRQYEAGIIHEFVLKNRQQTCLLFRNLLQTLLGLYFL